MIYGRIEKGVYIFRCGNIIASDSSLRKAFWKLLKKVDKKPIILI